jgi:hypothetical protein
VILALGPAYATAAATSSGLGRERDNVRRAYGGQLRVDAREVPEVHDRAPAQRGVGVRAGRDDLARGLDPRHERQLDRAGPALAVLEVNAVDADPAVTDEELVGARNRIGTFDRPLQARRAD